MEEKRVQFNIKTAICGPCNRKDNDNVHTAVSFCKTCQDFLCITCLKPHRRLVVTSNHKLLNRDHSLVNDDTDDESLANDGRDIFEEMRSKLSVEVARLSSNSVAETEYVQYRHRTLTALNQANLQSNENVKSNDEKKTENDVVRNYEFIESCEIHQEEKVKFYCKFHKQLCCDLCKILHHKLCMSNVRYIPDDVEASNQVPSDLFKKFQDHISEFKEYDRSLQSDLRELKKSRDTSLHSLQVHKMEVLNWVNLMEVRAIRRLDIVYDKCKKDIEMKRKKSKEACNSIRAEVYFLKEALASDVNDDIYKYIMCKKSDKIMENTIEKKSNRKFTNTRFSLKVNTEFEDIKRDINHLFELKFEMKGEDKFNVSLKSDDHVPNITGCAFLPHGHIVLTDRNNANVKVFNVQMKPVSKLTIDGGVFDLTVIDSNEVAVTSPLKSKIQIIDCIPGMHVSKVLDTGFGTCWGVKHHEGSFIINVTTTDASFVRVIDLESKIIFQVQTKCNFYSALYLDGKCNTINIVVATAYEDYSDKKSVHYVEEHIVEDNDMFKVWEYSYLNHLHTKGVALDGYNNPVVCCQDTDQIYTISRTGDKTELLLAESDGLCRPQTLCYNEDESKLMVTAENTDFIHIFKFEV